MQATVLHFPAGAICLTDGLVLGKVGAPRIKSALAHCYTCLFRSAVSPHTFWRRWLAPLEQAAASALPFEALTRAAKSHADWVYEPIVLKLAGAAQNFPRTCFGPPPSSVHRAVPKRFIRQKALHSAGILLGPGFEEFRAGLIAVREDENRRYPSTWR